MSSESRPGDDALAAVIQASARDYDDLRSTPCTLRGNGCREDCDCRKCFSSAFYPENSSSCRTARICPRFHCLYVVTKGAASARHVQIMLRRLCDAGMLEPQPGASLSVAGLGSGPGTDLLGALLWAREFSAAGHTAPGLVLRGLDKVEAWRSQFFNTITSYHRASGGGLGFRCAFSSDDQSICRALGDADVVVMSWFWSDVINEEREGRRLQQVWSDVVALLPIGCRVIICDTWNRDITLQLRQLIDETDRAVLLDDRVWDDGQVKVDLPIDAALENEYGVWAHLRANGFLLKIVQ